MHNPSRYSECCSTNHKALVFAKHTIVRGFYLALPQSGALIYLLFEHSENPEDQEESVRLSRQLAEEHPSAAGD